MKEKSVKVLGHLYRFADIMGKEERLGYLNGQNPNFQYKVNLPTQKEHQHAMV